MSSKKVTAKSFDYYEFICAIDKARETIASMRETLPVGEVTRAEDGLRELRNLLCCLLGSSVVGAEKIRRSA